MIYCYLGPQIFTVRVLGEVCSPSGRKKISQVVSFLLVSLIRLLCEPAATLLRTDTLESTSTSTVSRLFT